MNDICRVIRIARRRLLAQRALSTACLTATVAVAALIVARLIERLGNIAMPWETLGWWASGSAVFAALGWAVIRRGSSESVARTVDEHANLRESLSTALAVERETDPWSRAVVESATRKAKAVRVREALPMRLPESWWHPLAAGLALLVVWFTVPRLQPTEGAGQVPAADEVAQAEQRVIEAEQKIEELLSEAGAEDLIGDAEAGEADTPKPTTPDEIKRAAIRDLTNLADKIDERLTGPKGQTLADIQKRLSSLKQPGPGPLNELSRSLARGEFAGAKEQLEQLAQQMGSGAMDPQQAQQLQKQLANMAKQMDDLAKQNEELKKKLQEAGMGEQQARDMAANPEALKKALEQMEGLSDEQKQELSQMAESMAQSGEAMSMMASAMSQMSQGMGEQGMSQQGMQGMDQMAEQLSQMEMLAEEMSGMNSALSETMKQLQAMGSQMGAQSWSQCEGGGLGMSEPGPTGRWRGGDSAGMGPGSGGPGQGNGSGPDEEAVDFALQREKAAVQTVQGKIIASRLVFGEQVRGESMETFKAEVDSAIVEAADAIETNLVPRQYQGAVKHYFGTLEQRVTPTDGTAPKPASPPTSAPAGTPKPAESAGD